MVHRSQDGSLETFLGLGGWGALWRRVSQRAQQQRATERRGLPRTLAAKGVEDFRNLLDTTSVVARADGMITDLEAVVSWGKELWRSRTSPTVVRSAPEGSPWQGALSREVMGQSERWATEAEGVILGGLAAAARLLHPPGGGAQGRFAGVEGSRNGI